MKLEIERKFLLKAMPDKTPSEIVKIDQWYWKNSKGVWERARSWDSNINGMSWIHTIKKSVAKGINIEDEHNLTKEEYEFFTKRCKTPDEDAKFISKERWIYPDGDLKWEVDIFNSGHHLIVAEIEIPKKSFKVNIPDFIKDKLLMEVTEIKQFSNRNLSNKI
jgi:CYTH domain-containing protein